MEFQEFIVYTFLSLIGVTIILGIVNLIFNTKIVKRFSGKYIKILANYELQSENLSSLFTVTFFNNNMADIKVHSFGFMYCNEQVDFYEEYKKINHPELIQRMVIEPADSVKLQVPYDRMKKMLLAIRNNRSNLNTIYGYIIDSNGNQTTKSLKDIYKNMKRIFKSELQDEKNQKKEFIKSVKKQKKENKLKSKQEHKEQKAIIRKKQKELRIEKKKKRRANFKSWWNNVKTKIGNFLKSIKKKLSRKKESE